MGRRTAGWFDLGSPARLVDEWPHKEGRMARVTYEKEVTALLVIDAMSKREFWADFYPHSD